MNNHRKRLIVVSVALILVGAISGHAGFWAGFCFGIGIIGFVTALIVENK